MANGRDRGYASIPSNVFGTPLNNNIDRKTLVPMYFWKYSKEQQLSIVMGSKEGIWLAQSL